MGASFLNLVATKVTVKGEEQKFVSLHLRQGFNRHHTFTVMVNYRLTCKVPCLSYPKIL